MSRPLGWMALSATGVAMLTLGTADTAYAHVCMVNPLSRVGPECSARSPQKVGPCGIAQRGEYVTEFLPGETIVVELNETIDHPSHYRISFNPEGDDFVDPVSIDDRDGTHPYVLLDGIEDAEEARQSVQVTLPNVECDECTLQLIQVMYDKQGNGFGGRDGSGDDDNDDIYYSCADLVLTGEPVAAASPTRGIAPVVAPTFTGGGLTGDLTTTVSKEPGEFPRRSRTPIPQMENESAWTGRGLFTNGVRATTTEPFRPRPTKSGRTG